MALPLLASTYPLTIDSLLPARLTRSKNDTGSEAPEKAATVSNLPIIFSRIKLPSFGQRLTAGTDGVEIADAERLCTAGGDATAPSDSLPADRLPAGKPGFSPKSDGSAKASDDRAILGRRTTPPEPTRKGPPYKSGAGEAVRDFFQFFGRYLKSMGVFLSTSFVAAFSCGVAMTVFPFYYLFVGLWFFSQCPDQNLIGIFVIVDALLLMVKFGILIFRLNQDAENERRGISGVFESLLGLFAVAWFIFGSYLVFNIFQPQPYNPEANTGCNYVLYWSSFFAIVAQYVVICIVLTIPVFLFCVSMLCPKNVDRFRSKPKEDQEKVEKK